MPASAGPATARCLRAAQEHASVRGVIRCPNPVVLEAARDGGACCRRKRVRHAPLLTSWSSSVTTASGVSRPAHATASVRDHGWGAGANGCPATVRPRGTGLHPEGTIGLCLFPLLTSYVFIVEQGCLVHRPQNKDLRGDTRRGCERAPLRDASPCRDARRPGCAREATTAP